MLQVCCEGNNSSHICGLSPDSPHGETLCLQVSDCAEKCARNQSAKRRSLTAQCPCLKSANKNSTLSGTRRPVCCYLNVLVTLQSMEDVSGKGLGMEYMRSAWSLSISRPSVCWEKHPSSAFRSEFVSPKIPDKLGTMIRPNRRGGPQWTNIMSSVTMLYDIS